MQGPVARLSGGDYTFRIACHPRKRVAAFRREFGTACPCLPQTGADLGERMNNAFRECFAEGFRKVVLIGSDSPDLPPEIVTEAFQSLEKGGAVIGPAHDGGYYLLGFGRESFTPAAFTGIAWGGDQVRAVTAEILRRAGIPLRVLPVWRDIDRPEDLAALIGNCGETGFAGSHTMDCLRDYGLAGGR